MRYSACSESLRIELACRHYITVYYVVTRQTLDANASNL